MAGQLPRAILSLSSVALKTQHVRSIFGIKSDTFAMHRAELRNESKRLKSLIRNAEMDHQQEFPGTCLLDIKVEDLIRMGY